MFSRAAAAAAAAATARRAERATRQRHAPPGGLSGWAFSETTLIVSTPSWATRARSCASTAPWSARARALAGASTRTSARARAHGFVDRDRSSATSSAPSPGAPRETHSFADVRTEAAPGAARDEEVLGVPMDARDHENATRVTAMHRPKEYAVPVRAYYVGNHIDFHSLSKRLSAYPKEFFRECVVVRMTPRRDDRSASGPAASASGSAGHVSTQVGVPTLASQLDERLRLDTPDDLNDGIHPGARAFSGLADSKKVRRGGGGGNRSTRLLETEFASGETSESARFEEEGEDGIAGGGMCTGVNAAARGDEAGSVPRIRETPRYFVAYEYGSVVFFNMGRREREECLKLVRSFTKTPLAVPRTDDYRVMVRPGLEPWAQFEADHVVLKRLDLNNISVIGTVLAQTVALEHHEVKVDNMIEIFSRLNKTTEETGEMDISKAKLFKLVAENNNTLTELVTRMRLLGRSDTAWQYAQYDAVWNGLRKDFELEDRFDHLDYKLNLIQTQVKFYLEILQNRKSDTLEWIIIVLISMEILVSLYDMSTKLQ